jgi:exopolysaccharide production protein ExoQ
MLISGSRSVSRWFDSDVGLDAEAGSPVDRLVLGGLILLALLVLHRRGFEWHTVLRYNRAIIVLFSYMAASVLWSDYPMVSMKRWVRSVGVVVMAFVLLSEREPRVAFESVLRRCAYVLLPLSYVLVKYFPALGRVYGRWDGLEMWTGVTTHKNGLGQISAASAFVLLWALLRDRRRVDNSHVPVTVTGADVTVACLAIVLLLGPGGHTYSATSIAILLIGVAGLVALHLSERLARDVAKHALIMVIGLSAVYWLFAEVVWGLMVSSLNRNETLTGRTGIWATLLEAAAKGPFVGVGYGGFWMLNPIAIELEVGEAHNGYLDVYLELGGVGIVALAGLFVSICRRVRESSGRSVEWGVFGVSFLFMSVLYNVSESALFDVYWGNVMMMMTVVLSERSQTDTAAQSARELEVEDAST